ncbi:MAG: hypothetical protein LBS58_04090 [Coriobacteriales bacterium]|nr:hypothetical protein [Coriobacteriales bacterium]
MSGSSVRGLKYEETASEIRFVRFFDLVQAQAAREGCVFFMDSGEGRDVNTEDFDGEDVSGWLIPKDDADTFEKQWLKIDDGSIDERFDKLFVFARWDQTDEGVTIKFT